jgi:hypothetical protein
VHIFSSFDQACKLIFTWSIYIINLQLQDKNLAFQFNVHLCSYISLVICTAIFILAQAAEKYFHLEMKNPPFQVRDAASIQTKEILKWVQVTIKRQSP